MKEEKSYQLAHDLDDISKPRSKDVESVDGASFDAFLLTQETLEGLRKCGFKQPSPIQLKAVPLGLCGFDLVVQSKAGTGKTCVFALITLEALKFSSAKCIQTLILAPTREVAIQIHQVIGLVGSSRPDFSSALCIGGVDLKQDRVSLANCHCRVVIGTPGRLKQLIELDILKVQHIELFVLDEADKLMDEQFKIQIDGIYQRLPADKQMIVTSATYPNELHLFLQQYMKVPKVVRLGQELHLEAIEQLYVQSEAGHSTKKRMDNKLAILRELINKFPFTKALIFTNFQARAPAICDTLSSNETFVERFGRASYICAELPQADRCRVFADFRTSKQQQIMISTDVSARGIDVHDIDLVINFDIPNDNSTYYHRIGRAGRFGQPGRAISIVSNDVLDRQVFEKHVLTERIKEFVF